MRLACCICTLLLSVAVTAQRPKTFTVPAGVEVKEIVPVNEIYQFPQFVQGLVVFKDGKSAPGKLNYNRLIAEIQFIDPKGDTLSLANEQTIKTAFIGSDTFYYSEGYVRQLAGGSRVKMGERIAFKEFIQKPGAYGLSSATTATDNLTVLLNRRSVELNVSQELVLVKNTNYLIGDRFNAFVVADKNIILKMFPDNRPAIEDFIEKNKISFSKPDHMVQLGKFLDTL
jgi:hypothetical protein